MDRWLYIFDNLSYSVLGTVHHVGIAFFLFFGLLFPIYGVKGFDKMVYFQGNYK